MLLQRLRELEGRAEATPSMYRPTRVQWMVRLDGKGNLSGVIPLADGEGSGAERGLTLQAPQLVRTVAIRPILLCDRADYVLGLPQEGKEERTREMHREFKDLVDRCADATGERAVKAVSTFLAERRAGSRKALPKDLQPNDVVTFEVEGTRPIDLPSVRAFWADATKDQGADARVMTCLVCGERKPVERTIQVKIKGVPGGQLAGTALVSANMAAFVSYGLEQAYGAPTCRDCAEASHKALNRLLADPRSRLRVGESLVWVFWTRGARAQEAASVVDYLSDPRSEDVRALLRSPVTGKDAAGAVEAADFFATALSASGGRAVVRDYVETSTARIQRNLRRWFRLQRLADPDSDAQPMSVRRLCQALTHDVSKDMPPSVPQALVHAALTGGPLPDALLHLIVRRNRAEQGVTRPRAVLARMVLVSSPRHGFQEEDLIEMQEDNRDPAYLCGRLFAELEQAQRAALGDVSATIRDRYFGTASSAPASVFGALMRGSQAHLGKLRRERPGAGVAIEQRIEDIAKGLTSFPTTLDLRGQTLFSLGYYHQRAMNRAAARERKAEKERAANGEEQ